MYITDKTGKRCAAVERTCIDCKETKIIRKASFRERCRSCSYKLRPNFIKKDESFIIVRGKKNRAVNFTCRECGNSRSVISIDLHRNKSKLCRSCATKYLEGCKDVTGFIKQQLQSSSSGKEHQAYTTGLGIYQRVCREEHGENCLACGTNKNIHIHHIDCDRKNNDISNLIPLCSSCHKRIHFKLSDGFNHEESLTYIKINKVNPQYDKKSSYVKKISSDELKHCKICDESKKRIEVHHIDQDRTNNEISNLIPLCYSCHKLIHYRLKDGMTHDEAFEDTKGRKKWISKHR